MSCFPGRMKEYKEVSLDQFDGDNLSSTVYFLSHNHEDHTVGLAGSSMLYRLESNCHIKLYCSQITKELLIAEPKYEKVGQLAVGLPTEDPLEEVCGQSNISVPDPKNGKEKYKLSVTLLPAAHCPGSVMFLFEGYQGTALYTGDFRLSRQDLLCFPSLNSGNRPKIIDSLYVDTTFCVPQAFFIPSRDESADAVVSLVEEWLPQSPNHIVVVSCRAKLGYEHLFNVLHGYFEMPIHVSQQQYERYKRVAVLRPSFTTDPRKTQIHACHWNPDRPLHSQLPCGYRPSNGKDLFVRVIKLSTMYFTQRQQNDQYVIKTRHAYRVCYSFHSSYTEVRDMILYLKPKRAFPNVKPIDSSMELMQERVNEFVRLARHSSPIKPAHKEVVRLGKLRKKRKLFLTQSEDSDEDFDFGDDSEPKTKQSKTDGHFTFHYDDEDDDKDDADAAATGVDEEDEVMSDGHLRSNIEGTSGSDYTPVKRTSNQPDSLHSSQDQVEQTDSLMTKQDQELMKSFSPAAQGSLGASVGYISDIDNWSDIDIGEQPSLPARLHSYSHEETGMISTLPKSSQSSNQSSQGAATCSLSGQRSWQDKDDRIGSSSSQESTSLLKQQKSCVKNDNFTNINVENDKLGTNKSASVGAEQNKHLSHKGDNIIKSDDGKSKSPSNCGGSDRGDSGDMCQKTEELATSSSANSNQTGCGNINCSDRASFTCGVLPVTDDCPSTHSKRGDGAECERVQNGGGDLCKTTLSNGCSESVSVVKESTVDCEANESAEVDCIVKESLADDGIVKESPALDSHVTSSPKEVSIVKEFSGAVSDEKESAVVSGMKESLSACNVMNESPLAMDILKTKDCSKVVEPKKPEITSEMRNKNKLGQSPKDQRQLEHVCSEKSLGCGAMNLTPSSQTDDDVIYVGVTKINRNRESDGYQTDAEDSDHSVTAAYFSDSDISGPSKSPAQRGVVRHTRSHRDFLYHSGGFVKHMKKVKASSESDTGGVIDLTQDSEDKQTFEGGSSDSYFYDSDDTVTYTPKLPISLKKHVAAHPDSSDEIVISVSDEDSESKPSTSKSTSHTTTRDASQMDVDSTQSSSSSSDFEVDGTPGKKAPSDGETKDLLMELVQEDDTERQKLPI